MQDSARDVCLFMAALLLFLCLCACAGVCLSLDGCLVARWVIMLLVWSAYVLVRAFVWVFARVFISVFDWVLECVLDLFEVLRGCAAEILRRCGREESF